jgi:hypothetical protein
MSEDACLCGNERQQHPLWARRVALTAYFYTEVSDTNLKAHLNRFLEILAGTLVVSIYAGVKPAGRSIR